MDAAGETLLKQAMTELGLSARAHDKVLRVARTIADIDGQESIQPHHLAETRCTRGILAAAFWSRVRPEQAAPMTAPAEPKAITASELGT